MSKWVARGLFFTAYFALFAIIGILLVELFEANDWPMELTALWGLTYFVVGMLIQYRWWRRDRGQQK